MYVLVLKGKGAGETIGTKGFVNFMSQRDQRRGSASHVFAI